MNPIPYRGYLIHPTGRDRWMAEHIATGGVEGTVLPDGMPAVMTWRSRGALMRAIDRTYLAPGDQPGWADLAASGGLVDA